MAAAICNLLPLPKILRLETERVRLDTSQAKMHIDDSRLAAEWERLRSLADHSRRHVEPASTTITIAESPAQTACPQGYHLRINRRGIELIGGSPAGCFYGLKTLAQLIDPQTGEVPCGEIRDEPDFATRGLLHDVTRGKSPKLETLKLLADRLSDVKINQLQLYIEHGFVFPFDPQICGPDEGLTPEEIRELDRYCRERFIDLVPAVATLGHMGRILSMPGYRHLAEIEGPKRWEQMSWLERMRGFTLDVLNPQSRELVSRIWSDILDAFSSPVVNICGDEPWDLGRGKNASRLDQQTRGEGYVEHIRFTHDLCAARGRTTQLWGDVVRNYPHLLSRLPKDLTVLHWGYDDQADYAGTDVFAKSDLPTFVCPGTSGWKRIINAMDLAERNIRTFARAGELHAAKGLLNTDWGDFGHFNQLACSCHGIAMGAAAAWNANEPGGVDFDQRFTRAFLKVPSASNDVAPGGDGAALVQCLRRASAIAERYETWRLFALPDESLLQEKRLPTAAECAEAADAAASCRQMLRGLTSMNPKQAQDYRELSVACRFTELFAKRLRALCYHTREGTERPEWPRECSKAASEYAECWQARNKPLRLADILARMHPPDE